MSLGTEAVLENHRPSSPGYAENSISKSRLSRPHFVRISSASSVPFRSSRFASVLRTKKKFRLIRGFGSVQRRQKTVMTQDLGSIGNPVQVRVLHSAPSNNWPPFPRKESRRLLFSPGREIYGREL